MLFSCLGVNVTICMRVLENSENRKRNSAVIRVVCAVINEDIAILIRQIGLVILL